MNIVLVLVLGMGLFSCKKAPEAISTSVTIRLPNEPESLHPIFSKSIYASQIESLILLPLTEFDPVSLTLSPLLIEKIPTGEKVTEGNHAGGLVYHLNFRKEAVWDDGRPVTGEDYLFTFKAVYNPHLNVPVWRGFMNYISEIVIDPEDPKKVSVYMDSTYILAVEATTNFNLYPAHIYDPENIMSQFQLNELRSANKFWSPEQNAKLSRFAQAFESPIFFRDTVSGAGAYALDGWSTGEYIRIKRKENWWGDKVENAPLLLKAYPKEITYRFILDADAAEAAVKAGEIDLMAEVPVTSFLTLKNDPAWSDKLQFATPALTQINYLELNNRDPILADVKIRQALAYCIDYDGILHQVLKDFARRTIGWIHPDKNYYDKDLKPIQQDLNRSLALVKEAGWKDTNGNGTPDKLIRGKVTELILSLKTSSKQEGLAVANIIKENAAKVGITIKLDIVDPSQLRQDVQQGNYQIMPIRIQTFPSLDDPYNIWHSSGDVPGGNNRSGFHTPELDRVLEDLRSSTDPSTRMEDYKKFQEILYEQQPAIFLYVPLERIIASKKLELITSFRRPGYFENLIRPAGSQ